MEREQGNFNHVLVRGLILIGFTILLIKLIFTGDIKYFIAPKMAPFSYFSLVIFLLMGIGQLWRNRNPNDEIDCDCGSDHGTSTSGLKSFVIYSMYIIPILTGIFLSNNILDSAVAAKRGVNFGENNQQIKSSNTNIQNGVQVQNIANDPNATQNGKSTLSPESIVDKYALLKKKLLSSKKIIVTDDNYIFTINTIEQNVDKFIGKKILIKGFVYKEDGLAKNQIVVSRFGVTCCIADASIVGLLSTGKVSGLKKDNWIQIEGTLEKINYQGSTLPAIKINKTVKVIEPSDAYVYFK